MRIKIPIPESPPVFKTSIEVCVGDLNYGNHLGNDRLLLLAHESRLRYFKSIDQTELNFFGLGLIMTDSGIQYLAQGHWGDSLTIKVWHEPAGAARFDLFYEVTNTNLEKVALIKTGMAFFNYEKQKLETPSREYFNYAKGIHAIS